MARLLVLIDESTQNSRPRR